MARRIDRYKVSPGDDIGEPSYLTERFEDIDNRIHTQELKGQSIDERADDLERVALSRLDDVFTGVLRDAQAKLQDIGAWFKAESQTAFIPEIGSKRFILTEATRGGYVPTRDILFVSSGAETHFMVGQLVTYLPLDGALDVTVSEAFGGDEKSDWLIYPLAPGYADHLARTDNPHNVTAEQVGTYTQAEIDQALLDVKEDIRSGATSAFDTLDEIEAELNSGSTARAALISQVANKLDKAGGTISGGLTLNNALDFGDSMVITRNIGNGNRGFHMAPDIFIDLNNDDLRFYNHGREAMVIGNNGIVRKPNLPAFQSYRSGTIHESVNHRVEFSGLHLNHGAHFDAVNSRFTAPVTGVYFFEAHLFYGLPQNIAVGGWNFQINGAHQGSTHHTTSANAALGHQLVSGCITRHMSAGDYVDVFTTLSSGATLWPHAYSGFSGFLIG